MENILKYLLEDPLLFKVQKHLLLNLSTNSAFFTRERVKNVHCKTVSHIVFCDLSNIKQHFNKVSFIVI